MVYKLLILNVVLLKLGWDIFWIRTLKYFSMSNENAARKLEAIKSYSRYMNRRGFEDPKYYRKCGECNEVRYHRGRAANKC
jgi:hypothetical protein